MNTTVLMALGILLLLIGGIFFWWFIRVQNKHEPGERGETPRDIEKAAVEDVEHIFNNQFREELRNRGRLHFEKIIGENAMFLQQDLRMTTSQLNEYMKTEIKKVLEDEFKKYEESIKDAKDVALDSIQKTQTAIEQQRQILEKQLVDEVTEERARLLEKFEKNMTDIINHYILAAIGNQIELTDQLDYITGYLNENKQAILEDVKHGS
jgi:hypothetical protein